MPRDRVRTLPPSSPEIPRSTGASLRPLVLLVLLIVASGFLARQIRTTWLASVEPPSGGSTLAATSVGHEATAGSQPPSPSERVKIVPVSYQVDPEGRITKVAAPDPRAVLVGLCQHDANLGVLQPLAIAPGQPPNPGQRIGVVQDRDRPAGFSWVRISLDPRTRRWCIGDGKAPVVLDAREDLPPAAEMLTF